MIIHFIRHGNYLIQNPPVYPPNDVQLSDEGIQQINQTCEKLEKLDTEQIIASPLTRASQSAEIISQHIDVPVELSELFIERKRPSGVINKPVEDKETKEIMSQIKENYHNPNFHYSDEENYEDLKQRGTEALKYLRSLEIKNLIVVTHSEFLAMVLSLMALGEELTSQEFSMTKHFFYIQPGGIISCEKTQLGWRLITK